MKHEKNRKKKKSFWKLKPLGQKRNWHVEQKVTTEI